MGKAPEELGAPDDLVGALIAQGIDEPRLLDAYRRVRRRGFVPAEFAHLAYEDEPIPIGHAQVTTQPSLVGRMVAALQLEGTERVLEIGTGLGFQTAVLATLAREVYSVERIAALAEQARANLAAAGITNATVVVGDGTRGLPEHAPYDAIITCAASPRVPPALVEQLAPGGRLVHPLGPGGDEEVIAYRKRGESLSPDRRVVHAYFVPMIFPGSAAASAK